MLASFVGVISKSDNNFLVYPHLCDTIFIFYRLAITLAIVGYFIKSGKLVVLGVIIYSIFHL